MADVAALLAEAVGPYVVAGDAIRADYGHDEALSVTARIPAWA